MASEHVTALVGEAAVVAVRPEPNHLSVAGPPHLLWSRSVVLADQFEESHVFVVVLELLRTARHDVVVVGDAVALGSAHLAERPTDLVAWRAVGLLRRALVFLGGETRGEEPGAGAAPQSASRWTSLKEKAGRQIETYSAPSADGVL
jgi:hypothetical protein